MTGRPWWAEDDPLAGWGEDRGAGQAHVRGACRSCPMCLALSSLEDARPEVVAHLREALRHAALAGRAWLDAAAAPYERIDLDEPPDTDR